MRECDIMRVYNNAWISTQFDEYNVEMMNSVCRYIVFVYCKLILGIINPIKRSHLKLYIWKLHSSYKSIRLYKFASAEWLSLLIKAQLSCVLLNCQYYKKLMKNFFAQCTLDTSNFNFRQHTHVHNNLLMHNNKSENPK